MIDLLQYTHINHPSLDSLGNSSLESCIPTSVLSPKNLISRAQTPLTQTKVLQVQSRKLFLVIKDDTFLLLRVILTGDLVNVREVLNYLYELGFGQRFLKRGRKMHDST